MWKTVIDPLPKLCGVTPGGERLGRGEARHESREKVIVSPVERVNRWVGWVAPTQETDADRVTEKWERHG